MKHTYTSFRYLITILLVSITLSHGCIVVDDDLNISRKEAKKQLYEAYNYPYDITYDLLVRMSYRTAPRIKKKYQRMINTRFIEVVEDDHFVELMLTEKCDDFILSERKHIKGPETDLHQTIHVCKVDFGEITGIKYFPESQISIVEYTYTVSSRHPFTSMFSDKEVGTHSFSRRFRKYDDGWRLLPQ